jgi:NADH:ubiquinone oxidoreductase subunit C
MELSHCRKKFVDKNQLLARIHQILPGTVLEVRRFGREGPLSLWIEAQSLLRLSHILKNDFQLDLLEHLSVAEFEKVLVASYFLRSYQHQEQLILRISLIPASVDVWVEVDSVVSVWPMAASMEREMQEMFGIRFLGLPVGPRLLPEHHGFVLRKGSLPGALK